MVQARPFLLVAVVAAASCRTELAHRPNSRAAFFATGHPTKASSSTGERYPPPAQRRSLPAPVRQPPAEVRQITHTNALHNPSPDDLPRTTLPSRLPLPEPHSSGWSWSQTRDPIIFATT